jgi:hypothetical protein
MPTSLLFGPVALRAYEGSADALVEVLEEVVGGERHSAARYWQAIKPMRCRRRKSP